MVHATCHQPTFVPSIFLQYAVECNNLNIMPEVTFTINGIPYTLSAQAYTLMVQDCQQPDNTFSYERNSQG